MFFVTLQARMKYTLDLRVAVQVSRDLKARGVLLLDAYVQRLHSAQQQIGDKKTVETIQYGLLY